MFNAFLWIVIKDDKNSEIKSQKRTQLEIVSFCQEVGN